ncbi:YezD family protein [Paenibacillus chibensis]|uniref:YezD family protein n=1 Tax=Paenibacillus chibensis TaxID=59846 RepID=A0ABU6PY23_9BACL|nr:YezD family protein [Paenibacillus chibensis]
MAKGLQVDKLWLERIAGQLNDMEFGSLHIVVHEGQIVQMERTERKRFENVPAKTAKTGISARTRQDLKKAAQDHRRP